jgi:hypothetical protein
VVEQKRLLNIVYLAGVLSRISGLYIPNKTNIGIKKSHDGMYLKRPFSQLRKCRLKYLSLKEKQHFFFLVRPDQKCLKVIPLYRTNSLFGFKLYFDFEFLIIRSFQLFYAKIPFISSPHSWARKHSSCLLHTIFRDTKPPSVT